MRSRCLLEEVPVNLFIVRRWESEEALFGGPIPTTKLIVRPIC